MREILVVGVILFLTTSVESGAEQVKSFYLNRSSNIYMTATWK
jgi:hypothetical protein